MAVNVVCSGAPRCTARLARFSITTGDAARLADFYCAAFDCRIIADTTAVGPHFHSLMGVTGGARRMVLSVGLQLLELVQFERAAKPALRPPCGADDPRFQHFAIVVGDIGLAYRRLQARADWSAISRGGPQRLPQSSGGVTAYKFRDPEGHALELLQFAPADAAPVWQCDRRAGNYLGIDHSAIVVSDLRRSTAYYQGLGLSMAHRSYNHGVEQERLDALEAPRVDVIAMRPDISTPHVELLHYRDSVHMQMPALRNNDIRAMRLIFESRVASVRGGNEESMVDPDGHLLQILSP